MLAVRRRIELGFQVRAERRVPEPLRHDLRECLGPLRQIGKGGGGRGAAVRLGQGCAVGAAQRGRECGNGKDTVQHEPSW
ncbi:MAG: hypothetical protein DMD66_00540 [Gemmatimonadetes bacterium]|nr:MAG: hypothetical protein DMD66_00540 [Gemmatimonadota bacterium]